MDVIVVSFDVYASIVRSFAQSRAHAHIHSMCILCCAVHCSCTICISVASFDCHFVFHLNVKLTLTPSLSLFLDVNGIKINQMAHTYTNRADNRLPTWLNDAGFIALCLMCLAKMYMSPCSHTHTFYYFPLLIMHIL